MKSLRSNILTQRRGETAFLRFFICLVPDGPELQETSRPLQTLNVNEAVSIPGLISCSRSLQSASLVMRGACVTGRLGNPSIHSCGFPPNKALINEGNTLTMLYYVDEREILLNRDCYQGHLGKYTLNKQ